MQAKFNFVKHSKILLCGTYKAGKYYQYIGITRFFIITLTNYSLSSREERTVAEERTCHTQVLNNGNVEPILPPEDTDPLHNTVRFARDNGNPHEHIV